MYWAKNPISHLCHQNNSSIFYFIKYFDLSMIRITILMNGISEFLMDEFFSLIIE